MLSAAAAFCVGCLLIEPFPYPRIAPPGVSWIALPLVGLALGSRSRRLTALALVALLLAGLAAGAHAWRGASLTRLEGHPRGLAGPWRVAATVQRDPWPTGGGAAFRAHVDRVLVDGDWRRLSGVVEIALPRPPTFALARGDRIETFLALRADRPPANPGLPRRDRLGVRGVDLRSRLKSELQIRRKGGGAATARRLAALRDRIRATLENRVGARSGEARALVLGERGGMEDAALIRLARSGLIHLFAISGLHVGLIAGGVAGGIRLFGGAPRLAAAGAALAAIALALLVAPAAPIRRAAIMTVALTSGPVLGRRHDAASALGLAVLAIAWSDPRAVHSPGFQMSALATAGLVLGLGETTLGGLPRGAGLLAASTIAQAWVAPVLASTGAPLPLLAPLLNVVALPLLAATLGLLAATLLLEAVPAASVLTGALAERALAGLLGLAEVGARGPGLYAVHSTPAALLWWGGLLLAVRPPRPRWRPLALLPIAAAALLVWPGARDVGARLHVLDVGQGDAIHLRAGDSDLLIDAGGYPGLDYDVGAHLVVPALRQLGVHRLRAAALSHAHADHAGGLGAAIAALRPRELWMGVTPADDSRALALRASGTPTLLPRGAPRPFGDCRLRTLLPPARFRDRGLRKVDNEASLVLVAECGPVEVWLTGDAGAPAETSWPSPGAARTLLKVGHHGSASATSEPFLDRLRPRHAVISVGARNAFGLPRDEVVARLRSRAIAVYRTDRDGALTVRLDGRVRVRGERWSPGG